MKNKTCIITGASSGIGKEIALSLARQGANVSVICRNAEKGQQVLASLKQINPNSKLFIADLSQQSEIKNVAAQIRETYSQIDVLINNAGVVELQKKLSADNIELTLATNVIAPFLLTNELLPLLKQSENGRIINISSGAHAWATLDLTDLQFTKRKYSGMKVYAQSKLLLNLISIALAENLQGTNVTVNCVHPGAVNTNLGSGSANNIFLKLLNKLIKSFLTSTKQGADTAIYLATSNEVQHITGEYFEKRKIKNTEALSKNLQHAKQVWQLIESMIL